MIGRGILLGLAIALAASPVGASERIIEDTISAAGIDVLRIENGVGDVRIEANDLEEIQIVVTLTPRRGGVFSSMKKAEQEVQAAALESSERRGRLLLEIDSSSPEPRFEARWSVRAPSRIGLELEIGVGDVHVAGSAGGVETELGVGNAVIAVTSGDVEVSVGVGNGTVQAPAAAYRSASASGGVGGASIEAEGDTTTGKGFVSHSSSWSGQGEHRIELEVGVGDAGIILD